MNTKASLTLAAGAGVFWFSQTSFTTPISNNAGGPTYADYPWSHRFPWQSYDHASIRRGHEVYQQVCASCHSLNHVAYRHLVDVCYTEDEAKALAADIDVVDGPDDTGEMFEREGTLTDYFPAPYENDEQARDVNGGAIPPDLSLVVLGRPRGENYIYSLLTGFTEPPAGISLRDGLYYNPYFEGGAIGMPPPLTNDAIEFDDGTPSSISQQAKDVTTFLTWAASPELDERHKKGCQALLFTACLAFPLFYYKAFRFSTFKTRVIRFTKLR